MTAREFLIKSVFLKLPLMLINILAARELRKELDKNAKKETAWHKEPNGLKWRNINGRQEMIIPPA